MCLILGKKFMRFIIKSIESIGAFTIKSFEGVGRYLVFIFNFIRWLFTPPFHISLIFKQLEFVGNQSALIIMIAAVFTGAVLGLQLGTIFLLFRAESLIGATTAKAMALELAPVLSGFIITGRAGAAMTAEIGTMRVSEQLDAMEAMGVNPINYLAVPRILAGILMTPLLTSIFLFVGILGCYFMVHFMYNVDEARFFQKLKWIVEWSDVLKGIVKAFIFGFILSSIACFRGFQTTSGARGVGQATTKSVVTGLIYILLADLVITFFQVR